MLLDFKTMKTRPLTSLANHGALTTFDITPDGRFIVFDRSRENSNILLCELPAKSHVSMEGGVFRPRPPPMRPDGRSRGPSSLPSMPIRLDSVRRGQP
jgi:hypothetical protein